MSSAEAAPSRRAAAGTLTAKATRPPRVTLREALWAYLGLAVLWTFAVAQPLFDLLKDNPEFFAARGSSGFDIVSFSVLLVVLPPLLMLAIELLVGLAGRTAREGAHLVLIAILVALIAAQALKKALDLPDPVMIVAALAIGSALATLYAAAEPVQSFLRVLSPAPVIFLALFLLTDPISKLAFPDEAQARTIGGVTRAPIVVVLFDELPITTLMDDRGRIDARRFPGFGELAATGTWYRNAYTVYDSTERAQPAIMDGNLPEEDKLPTSADHPNSIFSLFGKTHRMNVSEEATSVCSRDLCDDERLDESYGSRMGSMSEDLGLVWLHVVSPPDIESDLPSVSENWGNFGGGDEEEQPDAPAVDVREHTIGNLQGGREARFEQWIDAIEPGRRPQLAFKHTLLPHVPWQYLPDARRYRRAANEAVPGLSTLSYEDQGQLNVLLQRHILQTGFADYELRQLWRHLKDQGMFDDALIVVASDHGVAFPLGSVQRRRLKRGTAAEIAPIPLLIKAPGQTRGRIDDAWVETIDILPTIFDVLELDPRVEMDGRPASSPEVQRRDELRMLIRNTFEVLRIPADEFERERQQVIERNVRLFGTGRDGPERIYRLGPNQELLGRPASAAGDRLDVDLVYGPEYDDIDLDSPYLPNHVVGRVRGEGKVGRQIAVAVNGTIAAVGTTFELVEGDEGELMSVMVPPSVFRQGRNRVEVFEAP
jgi:sulfatase-like protein